MISEVWSQDVSCRQEGEIGYIKFENDANFNGLTLTNVPALKYAVETLSRKDDVKVIVLSGSAKYFCSGGSMDLLDELGTSTVERRKEILHGSQQILLAIKNAPALVYAQLEGLAAGAGVDLLLSCDQVVAAESARINFSFSKFNIVPDQGGLFLLAQKVGQSRAMNIYCRSETLDVHAMQQLGLISETPVTTFADYSWKRSLRAALSVSKEALAAAKQALWAPVASQFAHHLEIANDAVSRLMGTEQYRSAVRRTRGMQSAVAARK